MRRVRNTAFSALLCALTALTVLTLAFVIYFIVQEALPTFEEVPLREFLFGRRWMPIDYTGAGASFGIFNFIMGTLSVSLIAMLLASLVGLGAAVFLSCAAGTRTRAVLYPLIDLLAGIPSIVYGLFGMLFFVNTLKWGFSVLAGAFTLSIMILPLIMRTAEEALKSVPDSYREASFGLGAGKLRTIFTIVLPSAVPGILAGVILAIGRVIGETAALIYTAGTVAEVPKNLMGSGRTLALHMYVLSGEGLHMNQASATAVVILAFVLVINFLSGAVAKRIAKG